MNERTSTASARMESTTVGPPMTNPQPTTPINPPHISTTKSDSQTSRNPSTDNRSSKTRNWTLRILALLAIAGIAVAIFYAANLSTGSNISSDVPTAVARTTTLLDKVVEQGVLESQSTVTGNCEIDDYENKIIFLAPEGKLVKKDEVVVKFDDSEIKEEITERESRVNESKAEVETARQELKVQEDENIIALRKAKQDLKFADLDLKKYVDGDYKVKKSEIEQAISEAQTAVDQANRDMENTRALVKRGFREYQQLEEAKQVVKSANLKLINAKQKLDTLENFEHVKSLAEFEGKAVEAKHALEIAETTAAAKLAKAKDRLKNEEAGLKIQENRLKEMKKDLKRHIMKAPQDGTLTYARDNWRGNGEKLHEGAIVYRNQPVFILPDMKRMQVKVGIHETLVSKVAKGQSAVIKVDAFAGLSLTGKVKSVSQMSASTRWERSNNYSVIVTIDAFPENIRLKPGMNAEVEILVGKYEDRLAVPIQAVTSFGQKKYVFVRNKDKFESREVETDESTISFVSVTCGVKDGDVVALDAYQRGLAEFNTEDTEKMLELELNEMEAAGKKDAETKKESKIGKTSEETATEQKDAGESKVADDAEQKESATADDSNEDAKDASVVPTEADASNTANGGANDGATAEQVSEDNDTEDVESAESEKTDLPGDSDLQLVSPTGR